MSLEVLGLNEVVSGQSHGLLFATAAGAPPTTQWRLFEKTVGGHRALAGVDARPAPERLEADLAHWHAELGQARESSELPHEPPAFDEVHDFVVSTRLGQVGG